MNKKYVPGPAPDLRAFSISHFSPIAKAISELVDPLRVPIVQIQFADPEITKRVKFRSF
jgi:hypothetical protein